MSVSSLFRYLNIKVSVVHEQTLINYVRLSSETDKSNFSYQILNHRLFIERWACSYRPQALRRTKRSSGDLHNKAWVLLIKSQSSTASNSFSLHCLKWKWVFTVVLAVVFYFIFCSVPGLLHASLCPILAVTFWKTLVIDAFHFHDQRDPYHELMDESSWRNIYISTAWSNIQLNTDSEQNTDSSSSACPVKPSTVNDLWEDKGWRFL